MRNTISDMATTKEIQETAGLHSNQCISSYSANNSPANFFICRKCCKLLPAPEFRIKKNRHGNPYRIKDCYRCVAELFNRYYHIRNSEKDFMDYRNVSRRKSYYKNNEAVSSYRKEYYTKNVNAIKGRQKSYVDNLHPSYVLTTLCRRQKHLRPILKQHPEIIECERIRLALSRMIKNGL